MNKIIEKIKYIIAIWLGKISILYSKILGRRGTVIAGNLVLKIIPDFLEYVKGLKKENIIYVTGTNGKTTTVNILVNSLENMGYKVTSNLEGANMKTGIVNALVKDINIFGRIKSEYIVMETDERYLEEINNTIPAKYLSVTNIQKDDAKRNGTPEYIYEKIKRVVSKVDNVFLNADEPNSSSLERYVKNEPIYFSVDKNEESFIRENKYSYTMACYYCSNKIDFDYFNLEKVGKYICSNCGNKNKEAKYKLKKIDFENKEFFVEEQKYKVKNFESYFLYNYINAISILRELGFDHKDIIESFSKFKNVEGRLDTIRYNFKDKNNENKFKDINFVRIKQESSETLQTAINFVASDTKDKTVVMFLDEIEEYLPYYANIFYTFEVDFSEMIKNSSKIIAYSKVSSYDIANRLIYEGCPKEKITVISKSSSEDIFKELEKEKYGQNIYLIAPILRYDDIRVTMKDKIEILNLNKD